MSIEQENQTELYARLVRELPDEKFAKPQLDQKAGQAIDIPVALKAALADPIYHPPLVESVFAGDTVAIAIESNLPYPREILDGLMAELSLANIEPTDIVVVIHRNTAERLGIPAKQYERPNQNDEGIEPEIFTVDFGFHSINFQVHDSENQSGVAYLAANKEGEPVYVNRTMVESDFVIPIGFPKPGDISSQNDSVYPGFSNETIQSRFAIGKGSFLSRWEEVDLANETLGAFFTIQLICGPSDSIHQIVSGSRKQATETARRATNDSWQLDCPDAAEIVVATIESRSEEQDWDDFANAVITASQVSRADGPLIVWTDIGVAPDRKIRKALLSQFEDGINTKMTKTMQHVASIVNDRSVFLRSRLSGSVVEELGMGYIESVEEVLRISQPFSSGLLIRDAHQCQFNRASDVAVRESE